MTNAISFDAFREQWLEDIQYGNPSTVVLGRRFAHKLFTQWRGISDPSDDIVYLDGAGDGGIDLAYLERGEANDDSVVGDVWYLVQSKYGGAFQGGNSLIEEGRKVINTLTEDQAKVSEITGNLLARIQQFLKKARPGETGDQLILVFATERPLSEQQKKALDDIRAIGRERLGPIFDTAAVSLETIYLNSQEEGVPIESRLKVPIKAKFAESGSNLLIGSVPLLDLYNFLKAYRSETEDLDQLYEKNVRLFLGGRGRVNKGMKQTLQQDPAQFGLYNNGITIVVKDFSRAEEGAYELVEPYVVNGCQTTRTIWEVFHQKLESGGKGQDPMLEEWQAKAEEGVVVAKIVRVGEDEGERLLHDITRYTNSQNAVKEKDFVTLDQGFQSWKRQMAERYNVFLEVQRGGWDSRRALQKQNPTVHQFTKYANAFDLLKVYGAGWLREPGTAFGSNAAFAPGGSVYRAIVEESEGFGVDALYAAYVLQESATDFDFGRGSRKLSRRQTRFLYYMVALDLLRDVMIRSNMPAAPLNITQSMLKLSLLEAAPAAQALFESAVSVIDEYFTQGEEDSVFTEPAFKERFNNDLNSFLKWDKLGKGESTPSLASLMAVNKRTMGRGAPSPREIIAGAI